MNQDMTLAMRLFLDATGLVNGAGEAEGAMDRFVEKSKGRIEQLHSGYEQLERGLASVGVAIGALEVARESARADRDFGRIQLAAGATREEVAALREELSGLARDSGQSEDSLRSAFQGLRENGLGWDASRQGIEAINKALADGGGNAAALTDALSQAQESFNWDLSKPHKALAVMDELTAISRRGPANRDTLASIFAENASDARAGGFSPESTMALIEGVARSEPSPGKLQAMTRGIFGSFGNLQDRARIQLMTRVPFADAQGNERDPLAVLGDLQKVFSQNKSENDQNFWLDNVFHTDARTHKAFRDLLSRDRIDYIRNVATQGAGASGTIEKDLPAAMDNAADQANRLRQTLNDAGEEFARPINHALAHAIEFAMGKHENGGLGMDGKDMIEAAGGVASIYFGAKGLGWLRNALKTKGAASASLKSLGGLAEGIATGEALSKLGVTPVYVVNMPGSGMGTPSLDLPAGEGAAGAGRGALARGAAGTAAAAAAAWKYLRGGARMVLSAPELAAIGELGPEALALGGGLVGAAGAGGYGIGTLGYRGLLQGTQGGDRLGGALATILAGLGNHNAQAALAREFDSGPIAVTIGFTPDGRPYVDNISAPRKSPVSVKPALGANAAGSSE